MNGAVLVARSKIGVGEEAASSKPKTVKQGQWTREQKLALWTVLLALLAIVGSFFVPEVRKTLGLEKPDIIPPIHTDLPGPSVPIVKTPKPKPQPPSVKIEQHGNGNGAVGGNITSAPCSSVQVGGNNNQATVNCSPPPERHLLKEQCGKVKQELSDKQLTIFVGALNVDDAYDYAWDLFKCLKSINGLQLENARVMYMVKEGPSFTGIEVSVRGTPPENTIQIELDDRTPQGIVVKALVDANLNPVSVGMSPTYAEGTVAVIVGKRPAQP